MIRSLRTCGCVLAVAVVAVVPTPAVAAATPTCPVTHPVPLRVVAESEAEIPHLASLVMCTDGSWSSTFVINDGKAIWRLSDLGRSIPITLNSSATWVQQGWSTVASDVVSPGLRVVVDLPPERVRVRIDSDLTALDKVRYGLQSKVETWLGRRLVVGAVGSKPWGTAIFSCVGAARTAMSMSAVTDSPDAVADSVLGAMIRATTCARDYNAALQDELRRTPVDEGPALEDALRQLERRRKVWSRSTTALKTTRPWVDEMARLFARVA